MEIIELTYPHSLNQSDLPETVAAIGLFDGIHVGHQQVIHQAIEQATKEGREIQYIDYEPTDVPKMIVEDLNFDKAVRRKCEQMTTTIFDEMESETFNKWVFDISILMDIAKRKRI